MIEPRLLHNVIDQDTLVDLLRTREDGGGLGWPVDRDAPFQLEPEIAKGVKGGSHVTVSRLIPPSSEESRLVLLAEFERPYVRRDLRELLASVRRHIRATGRFADHTGLGDTLFIVTAKDAKQNDTGNAKDDYEDVRFVLFEEGERRLPRIRSFGWQRAFVGRTVLTHNLGRLLWSDRQMWERAWDVDALTDEFYNEFVKAFNAVREVTSHPGTSEQKTAYVQQLLNRLLFIAFIERMGWLKTPDGSSDYLHAQWLRYSAPDRPDRYAQVADKSLIPATFNGLLGQLFFNALDAPSGVSPGHPMYPILGSVPYLNGGLFSEEAGLDVVGVTVADEVFDKILGDKRPGFEGGLFRRFNFTVTESTPLDQEVAVDPEMLGKIFERIIIADERHQTGTYYTPRPIVEFMVNEALKGYLCERGLPADKAALLVDDDTVESDALSFRASEMQDALDWLFEARAVDPACGSGAYLLMLLQRLFELTDRLEVVQNKRRNPSQKHAYDTKLRLLERCVYGVDKSAVAVRIARLRLWLSLVVENKGEKPEPLPSFDFLIMCGDSLASPVKPDQHTLGHPHDAIREYTRMKRRYFHPGPDETKPTRDAMTRKRAEIARAFDDEMSGSKLRALASNPFDWEIDFAEVFDPQESEYTADGRMNMGAAGGKNGQAELPAAAARLPGFDIVLANPPFVNSGELLRNVGAEYKAALVEAYSETGTGSADLYVYFYNRALQILRSGGVMAFISSNKWHKAGYGEKLRRYVAQNTSVRDIVDFGELPVFQNVATFPMIFIAQKQAKAVQARPQSAKFVQVKSLDAPYPDVTELTKQLGFVLPPDAIVNDEWTLADEQTLQRLRIMNKRGTPLKKFIGSRIYRGILTGLNEAFVINSQTRQKLIADDPRSSEIIKPLAVGDDVRRWNIRSQNRWLLFTRRGTNIDDYPAVKQHLEQFRTQLEPKPRDWQPSQTSKTWTGRKAGSYRWYEIQDEVAYWKAFSRPKIVYPVIGKEPRFAFDRDGMFTNDKAFIIETDDMFLCGLLNSAAVWLWLKCRASALGDAEDGGRLELRSIYMEKVPVPPVCSQDRAAIEALVNRILGQKAAAPSADVTELEAEIDRRVEFLYFHADEAPTYDAWIAKQEAERGTDIAHIRGLIAGGENAHVEFKESVVWDIRQDKHSLTMRDEVLKEICAFLNADGGTILCGVHDTEGVKGLRRDLKHAGNADKLGLVLTNALGDVLRPHPVELVTLRFVAIDGETILRIDVRPDPAHRYESASTRPEDAGKKLSRTYVRVTGSAKVLEGQDLINWWDRRRVQAGR